MDMDHYIGMIATYYVLLYISITISMGQRSLWLHVAVVAAVVIVGGGGGGDLH